MFKRILSISTLVLGIGCAASALATPIKWGANFSPEAAGATGGGTILLTFDSLTNNLTIDADFFGLSAPTVAAHIHCCTVTPGTGTAAVVVDSPSLLGFPLGVTSGTYSHVFDLDDPLNFTPGFVTANGGTASGAIAALLTGLNAGRAYFNIHTTRFPGGEIRGFPTSVPEPAALVLFGLGLAGVAFRRRRRT